MQKRLTIYFLFYSCLPEVIGYLYVGGYPHPFGKIKLTKELKQLNYKIIECKFDVDTKSWIFMRERTDKSFSNAYSTAEAVMKSITEPVTEEKLLNYIDHMRYGLPNDNGDFRSPPSKRPRT